MVKKLVILCILIATATINVVHGVDESGLPCPLNQSVILFDAESDNGSIFFRDIEFENGTYFQSDLNFYNEIVENLTIWRGCPCLFLSCVFVCTEPDKVFDNNTKNHNDSFVTSIESLVNVSAFYIFNTFQGSIDPDETNGGISENHVIVIIYQR